MGCFGGDIEEDGLISMRYGEGVSGIGRVEESIGTSFLFHTILLLRLCELPHLEGYIHVR